MKFHFSFLLLFLFWAPFQSVAQNNYRFSYLFLQKEDIKDKSFHSYEMELEFDGKASFFYSEPTYLRDSLRVIAFDKGGNVADKHAYNEIGLLPAFRTGFKSWVDFQAGSFTQFYFEPASFYGTMGIEMPQWEFTDETEDQSGYHCKIAKSFFLGRNWIVWYTEEIPVNIGPWFLWGTPGLIVFARDSEDIINFRLIGVESIDEMRLENDLAYMRINENRPNRQTFRLSMQEMEMLHTKYIRDVEFMNKIHGIVGRGYTVDRNGNRIENKRVRPYTPIIPESYWKKR